MKKLLEFERKVRFHKCGVGIVSIPKKLLGVFKPDQPVVVKIFAREDKVLQQRRLKMESVKHDAKKV